MREIEEEASDEKLLAIDSVPRLVDELVLSLLLIQGAKLERVQLQSEPGTDFFEGSLRTILVKLVSMLSEEDKVSLIVQCDDSTRLQVRHLGEERCEHATNPVTEHRVKVVHDQLWVRLTRCSTMVHDLMA